MGSLLPTHLREMMVKSSAEKDTSNGLVSTWFIHRFCFQWQCLYFCIRLRIMEAISLSLISLKWLNFSSSLPLCYACLSVLHAFMFCMPLRFACLSALLLLPGDSSAHQCVLQRFNATCKALFKPKGKLWIIFHPEGMCVCSAQVHCVDEDQMGNRVDSETLSSAQLVLTCT